MSNPVVVRGASGAEYHFHIHTPGTQFVELPGIYAFCHLTRDGWWFHYVGQAQNLDDRAGTRVASHHKFAVAQNLGANHVLAFTIDCDAASLDRIEWDIIQALNPPLNERAPPGFGFRSRG